jgi:hypothetical protein
VRGPEYAEPIFIPLNAHSLPYDTTVEIFQIVHNIMLNCTLCLLQNIREQMAISLERMKELEEQVKLIPVLQVRCHLSSQFYR